MFNIGDVLFVAGLIYFFSIGFLAGYTARQNKKIAEKRKVLDDEFYNPTTGEG